MRLPSWFGGGQTNDIAEGEIKQLTDQFHITLRAHLSRIQALDGQRTPGTLQRLNELLNSNRPHSWSEAYESEQLFVQLYDEETLKTELDVRGLEAQAALRPPLAAVYAKQITDANSV